MSESITGKCLCGKIAFEVSGNPKFSLICHCTQCQKITGTGHSAQFCVEESKAQVTGELSRFELKSDSGNLVTSTFCETCGCPIYKTTSSMPGALLFHAGAMDNSSMFSPDMVVFENSKVGWDHVDPSIPRNNAED